MLQNALNTLANVPLWQYAIFLIAVVVVGTPIVQYLMREKEEDFED